MSEGRSRKRPALVVGLALVVALVTLDVGLRILDGRAGRDAEFYQPVDSRDDPLYTTHPYLGYVLRPGFEANEGKVQVRINSLGFRGAEREAKKPEGTWRVFCLGGSTTFGTGCWKDAETYPAQLEELLNQNAPAGRTYEVWNCGVSGYNTVESLINLQLRLLQYEPDSIVVYHAANDARPIQTRGFRPDYSHLRRSWTGHDPNPLDAFLLRTWRLYAWVTRGTDPEKQESALTAHVFVPDFERMHVPASEWVNEEGIDVFVRNLRHILAVGREQGLEVVLSTFASSPGVGGEPREDHYATVGRMNERIRALATAEDVPLADVDAELSGQAPLYDDWMHFNPAGSRQHALVVARAARQQGLFGLGR